MVPLAPLLYAVLTVMAVVFIATASGFSQALSPRDIGSAVFPMWLAVAMLALIVCDLVVSRRRVRKVAIGQLGRVATVVLLMVGAVYAMQIFGFFVALPVALFIGLWVAGSRSWGANLAFSVAMVAVLWLVFDRLLMIPIASM
jgi:nicotinamide riboside transporter PnuC